MSKFKVIVSGKEKIIEADSIVIVNQFLTFIVWLQEKPISYKTVASFSKWESAEEIKDENEKV